MMYDKKKLIIKYINDRLVKLEELGKKYSQDKIETLATNLEALDKPLEEIGEYFHKDHTTVMHAVDKIKMNMQKDENLRDTVETIKKKINPT